MKTRITSKDDTVVIEMEGRITFEDQVPFREKMKPLMRAAQDTTPQRLIFDFGGLDFVGSSGISNFVQILAAIRENHPSVRFCNVKSEFQRMIRAMEDEEWDFYENRESARSSFNH